MGTLMHWIMFAIIGYVCGSIPFGLLFSHWAGLGDIRTIGSGNIGATNVLRTGNKKIAALTLLCDGLKGYAPVLAASFYGDGYAAIAAGLGALVGHLFPIWLNFKGGKGVATGLGVTFGWSGALGLVFCAVWLVMFFATKISSVGALAAVAVVALAAIVLGLPVWPSALVAAAVWFMRRANIARLLKGEEPKSSFAKKA
jgi:acyl phosphate:glycerol-3-phosphate acyltransferase